MSNRLDYYFRQRVTEAELDLGFAELEQATQNLGADLGFTGVLANAVASQHAPVADLTVDVSGPGAILDQLGQRIFFSALQNVNAAQDDSGVTTVVSASGKEKVVSIFVKFDRALSDPRVDGNSLTVFFRRDESFKFIVVQGAEAPTGTAIPPPLRSDAILLADITRTFGQTQVLAGNISTARRQDAFVLTGSPRSIRRGRTLDALSDLLSYYNAHANGAADRHPAAAIDYAGGGNWADGSTNPGATVEAQLDKLVSDLAATSGAPKVGAAATAGAPNSLVAGTVKSQLDGLLGFINVHINNASGAHAASAITYAGGNNWADGTTNPANTVEGQLDKVINDLAATGGAAKVGFTTAQLWKDGTGISASRVDTALVEVLSDLAGTAGGIKIGTSAIAGTPNALAADSVGNNLSSLLSFINSHITNASGAHAASAISYAGGGNWADGTTNPATTVEAQLDKLISDLAGTTGATHVGAAASGSIPAGTVRSQLDFVMSNAGASPNIANTWTQPQTFNGASGDTSPALKTTTGPATGFKLLWEINLGTYKARIYANGIALILTVNAAWNGSQWVKDAIAASTRYQFRQDANFGLRQHPYATNPFNDADWVGGVDILIPAFSTSTLDAGGNINAAGTTISYIAVEAGVGSSLTNIGAGTNFRKVFPATPSSFTFSNILTYNLGSGPFSFAASQYGVGAFASASNVNDTAYFFSTVTAS